VPFPSLRSLLYLGYIYSVVATNSLLLLSLTYQLWSLSAITVSPSSKETLKHWWLYCIGVTNVTLVGYPSLPRTSSPTSIYPIVVHPFGVGIGVSKLNAFPFLRETSM
jgi:hypothetical protein